MPEDRLRRLARELKAAQETTKSLEVASSRQRHMMPSMPDIPGFDLGVEYRPASEVSGDFYDFFRTPAGEYALVIADVAGHGVEAGIIMGMAKATVSIYGRQLPNPKDVLVAANRDLAEGLDGKTFICLTLAFLDPETRHLRIARAGSNRPLLFNPGWENPEPTEVKSRGLALGLDAGDRFEDIIEETELTLQAGDLLLQYTDGLVEATNDEKEQFGEARVMELVKKYPRASTRELLFILEETLRDFTGSREQEDDITMMALKIRERSPARRLAFE